MNQAADDIRVVLDLTLQDMAAQGFLCLAADPSACRVSVPHAWLARLGVQPEEPRYRRAGKDIALYVPSTPIAKLHAALATLRTGGQTE